MSLGATEDFLTVFFNQWKSGHRKVAGSNRQIYLIFVQTRSAKTWWL